MMALLTAESRTRRQQGSRRVWCLGERGPQVNFFVFFIYFANSIIVYVQYVHHHHYDYKCTTKGPKTNLFIF